MRVCVCACARAHIYIYQPFNTSKINSKKLGLSRPFPLTITITPFSSSLYIYICSPHES